jgi:hypothetical protein
MYYIEVYFNGTDPLCEPPQHTGVFRLRSTVYSTNTLLLGNAAPVYALMTLEMNLGIICGCLSGIKPVLALFFPRLFGTSYQTSTHPTPYNYSNQSRNRRETGTIGNEPFPFHALSDVSQTSKYRDRKLENFDTARDSSANMNPEDKEQRNFAWASSSGLANPQDKEIPRNAIQVQTVVMRDVENVSSEPKSVTSDGGSEDWIMEGLPNAPEREST